ncbi:class I SAM-dependent methyltransferase [Acidiluteibacter ferrifornacis]|uniref:Methyltransferase domain-containing protein n=1 Tax=Acidiluteibacter ferrifornacis TaxID=2692424 RepID=A0A6N9NMR5_9FLAO|nr:class I SAM-dependent methyltransferase [Acidiluteibacter ferrifornacis]MBR9833166.1 class I SAM-dependent methyltransferase [bacterium]NBG66761.1 methyltransferase domain-containing protein [Acidiluteibacter ferrifornacis]
MDLKMTVEEFFSIFLKELEQNKDLHYYYKFLDNPERFEYRKAYFCQRLQYIIEHITDPNLEIWDLGCGFGTTDIFLSINGFSVHGTTLEHYYKLLPKRMEYWAQFGDVSKFTYSYENLFDHEFESQSKDLIIIQDTMHHLEPLDDAIRILNQILRPKGQLLIIEENGNNIIQNTKLFLQRGNKKIIEIYDETLQKNILLGNENIKSLKEWKSSFGKQNLTIDEHSVQYIRYYLPFNFPSSKPKEAIEKEQQIWKKNRFLKEYFFFGINFMVNKN